ncbi:hypothetical protein FPV67DRAFT_1426312, partial [Lyophyllum atratum]
PPNTSKELLASKKQKTSGIASKSDAKTLRKTGKPDTKTFGPQSYPWHANSCWIDTSLELLYATLIPDFDEYSRICKVLHPGSGLYGLYDALSSRRSLETSSDVSATALAVQRETFRGILKDKGLANEDNTFEPLISWLNDLLGREKSKKGFLATSYFQLLVVEVNHCTGSVATGGQHIQITDTPRREAMVYISRSDNKKYGGNFSAYCADFFAIERTAVHGRSCWRSHGAEALCTGSRHDYERLIVSIPISLRIEIQDESQRRPSLKLQTWDFPETILPHNDPTAKDNGIIYDLVHHLLFSEKHFKKEPSISYMSDDMVKLDKAKRFWLTNPKTRPTAEYLPTEVDTELFLDDSEIDSPESEEETSRLLPDNPSPLQHQNSSQPDSEFSLNCRCGLVGDGNILYHTIEGKAIQCDECRDWSHVACQKEGRASMLSEQDPFLCDLCLGSPLLPKKSTRTSERKLELNTGMNRLLKERLKEGCGVLARCGNFWYPARLIQREKEGNEWRIRWWRGCKFETSGIVPDTISTVPLSEIVDSLWMNRTERRKIRLGKWMHALDAKTPEDILSDPASIPYTKEVDDALSDSKGVLSALLLNASSTSSKDVPAKAWLEEAKKDITKALVPYVGSLSIIERARIANWFEAHISKDKKLRRTWIGLLPIAHAHTTFIASRLKADAKNDKLEKYTLFQKAWILQMTGVPSSAWTDVDVDRECLDRLEVQMFERSVRAGIAGHHQWGLDAGDHQDCWNPYSGLPEDWNHGDRDESEGELEVGPIQSFLEPILMSTSSSDQSLLLSSAPPLSPTSGNDQSRDQKEKGESSVRSSELSSVLCCLGSGLPVDT